MADRHSYYPARLWWLPGALALLYLVALILLPIGALLNKTDLASGYLVLSKPYTWRVIGFSLWQALLSTILSIGLALPLALALFRRGRFWGRGVLIGLLSLTSVMPTLVAITGLVIVYGYNGWLGELVRTYFDGYRFYGLPAILIAHVFFNFPLAVRVLLQRLNTIPNESCRLASQLHLGGLAQFIWIESHAIRQGLPSLFLMIFTLCFASFAVVLTLGGGPRATTIEVLIFQALRFDFDLATAITLSLVQLLICGILFCLSGLAGRNLKPLIIVGADQLVDRPPSGQRLVYDGIIFFGFGLLLLPIVAILSAGFNAALYPLLGDPLLWQALGNTLLIGLASGSMSVLLAIGLIHTGVHWQLRLGHTLAGRLLTQCGLLPLMVSTLITGTGLFILLHQHINVFAHALWIVLAQNALIGLPFALVLLHPAYSDSMQRHDRLCANLGVLGLARLLVVDWPCMRESIGTALGWCSVLAAGDLASSALFGSQNFPTLPLLLYRLIGSYHTGEASAIAMLLLLVCLAMFYLCHYLIGNNRRRAQA